MQFYCGAIQVAELVRQRIERLRLEHEGQILSLTVSIGLCAAIPPQRDQQEVLYQQADKALYLAKDQGRNRSCALPLSIPDSQQQSR